MMGDVLTGAKDIGMCIHVTHERWGFLDYTTYMYNERAFFLMAHPQTRVRWDALVSPFTPTLWLLFAISFIAIIPPLYFSIKMTQLDSQSQSKTTIKHHNKTIKGSTDKKSRLSSKSIVKISKRKTTVSNREMIFSAFRIPFAITLDQDATKMPNDGSGRWLVTLWLVFILVLGTGTVNCTFI